METTIYDLAHFIRKFEASSESSWCVGEFNNLNGQQCAQGKCGVNIKYNDTQSATNYFRNIDQFPEAAALIRIFQPDYKAFEQIIVVDINNGIHPRYQQPTPKQRILAALYDIKAKQQPEVVERIVYVTVDQKVRELQKAETLTN